MHARLSLLVVLIIASSVVSAASVEFEAPLYTSGGESASYELVDAPSGDYYVLLFDNVEAVILDGNSLEAIEDEATIQEVIDAYQAVKFDELNAGVKYLAVNSSFEDVQSLASSCAEGLHFFFSRTGSLCILYTRSAPNNFPLTHNALSDGGTDFINISSFNETSNLGLAHMNLEIALENMEGALVDLKSAKDSADTDAFVSGLLVFMEYADDMLSSYQTSSDYADDIDSEWYTEYQFMWIEGERHDCNHETELSSFLSELESAASPGDFETSGELLERITLETAERLPVAMQLKAAAENFDRYSELKGLVDSLVEGYSALGANVPALSEQGDSLEDAFNALNDTQASGTVEEREAEFDELFNEVSSMADGYNAAFESFSEAKTSVGNASIQLDAASEKYGGTDERIVEFKTAVQQLSSRVNVQSQALANGEFAVTVELDSIALNASGIAIAAYYMLPRENELDLVTIGGVIVLLLTLAGAFVYFKKYRDEGGFGGQPPEDSKDYGSSSSPGALVGGRENPDYQNPSNPYK